jgi:hypothetical protein
MRRLLSLIAVMTGVVAVCPAPGAAAASSAPPSWARVTATDGQPADEVAVLRTADGLLHVLWRQQGGPDQQSIRHTVITAGGVVGSTNTVTAGWASLGNPAAVALHDGTLRLFFAGQTGANGGRDGIQTATAGADGRSWNTERLRVSSTSGALTDGTGAAVARDGTPAFAFAFPGVVAYHRGTSPAEQDLDLIPGDECCGFNPQVAFDTTGAGYVAWFSTIEGDVGTYVQQVTPSIGRRQLAPQSATHGKAVNPAQRTPLVARTGGGVYLAYCTGAPTCTRVMLWKVGSEQPIEVAKGRDIQAVTATPAPDGRLWVMWTDAAKGSIYAARTDRSAREADAPTAFPPPASTATTLKLTGDATKTSLDVLASVSVHTVAGTTEIATWHINVSPRPHG